MTVESKAEWKAICSAAKKVGLKVGSLVELMVAQKALLRVEPMVGSRVELKAAC